MATLREWVCRVSGPLNRNGSDADLEEELRSHMEFARQQSLTVGACERDPTGLSTENQAFRRF